MGQVTTTSAHVCTRVLLRSVNCPLPILCPAREEAGALPSPGISVWYGKNSRTARTGKRRKGSSGEVSESSLERDFLQRERRSSAQPALRPPGPQPARSRDLRVGNIVWPEGPKLREAAAGLVCRDNSVLPEPSEQPQARLSLCVCVSLSSA